MEPTDFKNRIINFFLREEPDRLLVNVKKRGRDNIPHIEVKLKSGVQVQRHLEPQRANTAYSWRLMSFDTEEEENFQHGSDHTADIR